MTKAVLPIEPITEGSFDLNALAAWLAFQSDEVQATFLNEFDFQLRRACDIHKGSMGVSMQVAFIRKYLSSDAMYTLAELGERE